MEPHCLCSKPKSFLSDSFYEPMSVFSFTKQLLLSLFLQSLWSVSEWNSVKLYEMQYNNTSYSELNV
jgi:hypothetical protein